MKSSVWAKGWLMASVLLTVNSVRAADLQCFELAATNSPQNIPESFIRAQPKKLETWCYLAKEISGDNYQFVFRASEPSLRPENSALLKLNSDGKIEQITHGSLFRGETTMMRSRIVDVNPISAPLEIFEAKKSGKASSHLMSDEMYVNASAMMRQFAQTRTSVAVARVGLGHFENYLDDKHQPFAGYWWPFQNVPLALGPNSPLGKYDTLVGEITGTPNDSVSWEVVNHNLTSVAWGGHCNGWAASSVLYPDVTRYLWDAKRQRVIYPSDIKGMLAEASFCVDFAFYGLRYYGPGDDLEDIYPAKFHQVLLYYINNVKKPIAFDHFRDVQVDNHVITGYAMDVQPSNNPNEFIVTVILKAHGYEMERNEVTGNERSYPLKMRYTLNTDNGGNIVGGKWLTANNPDFLWIPLAQKNCEGENPHVKADMALKILETLPDAIPKVVTLNYAIGRSLAANETVTIPFDPIKGTRVRLTFGNVNFGNSSVYLNAIGKRIYPAAGGDGDTANTIATSSELSGRTVTLQLNDLSALVLRNNTNAPTAAGDFEITQIQYLGGN